jgi:hypothetical protein
MFSRREAMLTPSPTRSPSDSCMTSPNACRRETKMVHLSPIFDRSSRTGNGSELLQIAAGPVRGFGRFFHAYLGVSD